MTPFVGVDIFGEGKSYHHFLISHDGWIPMGLGQFPVATGPWSGVQVAIGLAVYLVSQLHRPLGPCLGKEAVAVDVA